MFARLLEHKVNAVTLRIAWKVTCWDARAIKIARVMACLIRRQCEPSTAMPELPELKQKDIAYDGYTD